MLRARADAVGRLHARDFDFHPVSPFFKGECRRIGAYEYSYLHTTAFFSPAQAHLVEGGGVKINGWYTFPHALRGHQEQGSCIGKLGVEALRHLFTLGNSLLTMEWQIMQSAKKLLLLDLDVNALWDNWSCVYWDVRLHQETLTDIMSEYKNATRADEPEQQEVSVGVMFQRWLHDSAHRVVYVKHSTGHTIVLRIRPHNAINVVARLLLEVYVAAWARLRELYLNNALIRAETDETDTHQQPNFVLFPELERWVEEIVILVRYAQLLQRREVEQWMEKRKGYKPHLLADMKVEFAVPSDYIPSEKEEEREPSFLSPLTPITGTENASIVGY